MGGGGSVDCVSPPTDPGWIEVVEKLLLLLLCHIPGGGGGDTHIDLLTIQFPHPFYSGRGREGGDVLDKKWQLRKGIYLHFIQRYSTICRED